MKPKILVFTYSLNFLPFFFDIMNLISSIRQNRRCLGMSIKFYFDNIFVIPSVNIRFEFIRFRIVFCCATSSLEHMISISVFFFWALLIPSFFKLLYRSLTSIIAADATKAAAIEFFGCNIEFFRMENQSSTLSCIHEIGLVAGD